jgi:hypothetical protein
MSISGLGSVTGISGTQYDFTNMTDVSNQLSAEKTRRVA